MEYKDYYQTLDIDKNANSEDIKKAYRKLTRKFHPDVNPNDKAAEARYKEINEAYLVLTDTEAKAKYDRLDASWNGFQRSGAQKDFDWSLWTVTGSDQNEEATTLDGSSNGLNADSGQSEFFQAVFGTMRIGQESPVPQKGQDYNQVVEISLEEAFTGTSRILRVGGRRLEVKIPRGARSGTKIRVRGEGAQGVDGGSKGDLYLDITITSHELFEWVGDDIHMDLPINLYSAVLGGEAIVPILKGKIKLKIPPETQSGKTFRLKGQGMPKLRNPDERGDLYAKVLVTLPEGLTEQEIELFEELADIRGL